MTTTAQSLQVRDKGDSLPYPILTDGNGDILASEMVYMDTSAHVVKALSGGNNTNAAKFAGVAKDSSYLNITGTKNYSPTVQIEVYTGGLFSFKTTAGDTYNHGDALYIGADAQTITNTDPGSGNKIGYAWMRGGQSAVAGAAGVSIDVLIAPNFPAVGVN